MIYYVLSVSERYEKRLGKGWTTSDSGETWDSGLEDYWERWPAVMVHSLWMDCGLKLSLIIFTRVVSHWPVVTTPTLLELCGAWPAVTPNIVLTPCAPPTNRKAPHVAWLWACKCICTRRVKSVKNLNYEWQKYKKITDSWECGREHNLRVWWRWHQPFSESIATHTGGQADRRIARRIF